MPIQVIGLDADDTLWHNETIFRMTHARFNALLSDFAEPQAVEDRLAAIERRNLGPMATGPRASPCRCWRRRWSWRATPCRPVLAEILAAGREMMSHPIEPCRAWRRRWLALADQAAACF